MENRDLTPVRCRHAHRPSAGSCCRDPFGQSGGSRNAAGRGANAIRACSCAGQLQPRHPADPRQQLLRLPRPRRKAARDRSSTSTPQDGAFAKRGVIVPGNAAESLLIEHDHRIRIRSERMPPPDSGHALTERADRSAAPMDRRRREVGHALGLRTAPDAPGAAAVRDTASGRATRSIASSSRASSARG